MVTMTLDANIPANCCQENRVAVFANFKGFVGIRVSSSVNSCPSNKCFLENKLFAFSSTSSLEDVQGDGHDFGANAIARENGDVVTGVADV